MNSSLPESPDSKLGKTFLNPEAHKKNQEQSLFVDGHVDLPHYMRHYAPTLALSELDHGPFTLKKAKESGVRLFATALYCEDRYNGEKAFLHLQDIVKFTLERFDHTTIVKNPGDLRRIKEVPGQLGTLLLLENADALAGNPAYVERLKETGIWIVGLTHAGKNRLADGNEVAYPDGFTEEGVAVVRALRENRIIIDVAHLHPKCFWQLLELFEGQIMTSHTGVKTLCDLPRNIDFDQAREIFERGGVIGITFNPEMLSAAGKRSEEQVFVHMDTLVQKFGPDGIGIGSDLCGFAPVAGGLEDISGISGLIDIMRGHGYADEAVKRIMGLNWLRVYETLVRERG